MISAEPNQKQPVKEFLHQFIVGTLGVLIAVNIVEGITYNTPTTLILASLVLGALNAFLRPLLLVGCLPLLILTLGLFLMVINAILLQLTAGLVDGFEVASFWSAFLGALVISIVTLIANTLTGNGDSKVRVGRMSQNQTSTRRNKDYDDDDGNGPVIDV